MDLNLLFEHDFEDCTCSVRMGLVLFVSVKKMVIC